MFCRNCGKEIDEKKGVCPNCGFQTKKENKIKKILNNKLLVGSVIVICIIIFVISFNTIFATRDVIKRDSSGKYYLNSDGEKVYNNWVLHKDKWYHTDYNGYIDTDKWIDGEYYVDFDGVMYKNQWYENRQTDEKYYLGNDGKYVRNTIYTIDDNDYYFDENGRFIKSTFFVIPGNSWTSYFDEKGVLLKLGNFITINGNTIYIDRDGRIASNQWVQANGNWYFVDLKGNKVIKSWIDNTYYVGADGVMLKNSKTPDGYEVDGEGKILEKYSLKAKIQNVKLVSQYSAYTTVDQMDTVTFGSYPQSDASGKTKEPIEWIVLERQNGKALLLSKYILDCKDYHNKLVDCTWEICSLRNWLNNFFYNTAFSNFEKGKILPTKVLNIINTNDYFRNWAGGRQIVNTIAGNNTVDNVFCLSLSEYYKYFYKYNTEYVEIGIVRPGGFNKVASTRGTKYSKNVYNDGYKLYVSSGDGNSPYWLRSPSESNQDSAKDVGVDGVIGGGGWPVKSHRLKGTYDGYGLGVRPAIWISY